MPAYLVDRSYERMRLDVFLVERLMLYSREQVQDFIKKGMVSVNDKVITKPHRELKFKDHVEATISEDTKVKLEKPEKRRYVEAQPQPTWNFPKPKIVAETLQYYVLDKPAGWLMHAAPESKNSPLISDFVLSLDPTLGIVGDNPSLRPGIVHRLDREASGLLLICRTQGFYDHVKQQFINRSVVKTYEALVFGHPAKDTDVIQFRIIRSRRKAKMAAVPVDHPDAKTATTDFEVLERFQHSTLLKLKIETGRTNQIRAHLAAYGLPIVGDTIYGKNTPANQGVGRVMLHSGYLSFFDLKGERVEFTSPLPPEFLALLEKARAAKK